MKMFIRGAALIAGGILAASTAQAVTIATFADPSPGPAFPLFTLDSTALTLNGGWAGTGLNLITPADGGPYADTKFIFSGTSITLVTPGQYVTGGGAIDFRQNVTNTLLLHITFDSGVVNAVNFGSTFVFLGSNVVFSGSILGYPVTDEDFSFAFANQTTTGHGFTATSSFTSSATIPAPGAAALLGLGGLIATRRRR